MTSKIGDAERTEALVRVVAEAVAPRARADRIERQRLGQKRAGYGVDPAQESRQRAAVENARGDAPRRRRRRRRRRRCRRLRHAPNETDPNDAREAPGTTPRRLYATPETAEDQAGPATSRGGGATPSAASASASASESESESASASAPSLPASAMSTSPARRRRGPAMAAPPRGVLELGEPPRVIRGDRVGEARGPRAALRGDGGDQAAVERRAPSGIRRRGEAPRRAKRRGAARPSARRRTPKGGRLGGRERK